MLDFVEIIQTERCRIPGHCEDDSTHTFQFGEVEFLICCNHAEEVLQRILNGEPIEQVMFSMYQELED